MPLGLGTRRLPLFLQPSEPFIETAFDAVHMLEEQHPQRFHFLVLETEAFQKFAGQLLGVRRRAHA